MEVEVSAVATTVRRVPGRIIVLTEKKQPRCCRCEWRMEATGPSLQVGCSMVFTWQSLSSSGSSRFAGGPVDGKYSQPGPGPSTLSWQCQRRGLMFLQCPSSPGRIALFR
jgi:hypothetical protein